MAIRWIQCRVCGEDNIPTTFNDRQLENMGKFFFHCPSCIITEALVGEEIEMKKEQHCDSKRKECSSLPWKEKGQGDQDP